MIVIIDYGMGNVPSILNMIRKAGGNAIISSEPEVIEGACALILPGVGSFDNAIEKLRKSGLEKIIKQRILDDKVPFLGICLGMHLLFDSSEEGNQKGLGLIPGLVKRFDFSDASMKSLKIPHMGWNLVIPKARCKLFHDLGNEPRFYFVHSYHVVCEDPTHQVATSFYGYDFACAIQKDNIYAVQFHPEKSHKFGMKLFRNFLGNIC